MSQPTQRRRSAGAWFVVTVLFLIPLAITACSAQHAVLGRLLALCVAFSVGVPISFWFALSPRSKVIADGAKLNSPELRRARPAAEVVIRCLLFAFACLLSSIALRLAVDVSRFVAGEQPVVVRGEITYNSTPFGVWFISQSLRIRGNADPHKGYYLLYSLGPRLRLNAEYELTVLPRSRFVLTARSLSGGNGAIP